jgi:hypothetical protein
MMAVLDVIVTGLKAMCPTRRPSRIATSEIVNALFRRSVPTKSASLGRPKAAVWIWWMAEISSGFSARMVSMSFLPCREFPPIPQYAPLVRERGVVGEEDHE